MKIMRFLHFILIGTASIVFAGDSNQIDILVAGKNPLPDISRSKILVDVRVTVKDGNAVKGLKAEDHRFL